MLLSACFFIDHHGCATYLYVMGFTSNVGHAGSDDDHYVLINLKNGEERHLKLYDRKGNDMLENKGDLWKIPIRQFKFRERCITKSSISRITIEEGGDDGWNIESIITMLDDHLLSVDFHVNRWVDGNSDRRYRKFVLHLV